MDTNAFRSEISYQDQLIDLKLLWHLPTSWQKQEKYIDEKRNNYFIVTVTADWEFASR